MIGLSNEVGLRTHEGLGASVVEFDPVAEWSLLDSLAADMEVTTVPPFIETTPTGLILSKDLTFEEWAAIAGNFGKALQTAAWCIGDWMVYGERKWGKQLILDGAEFDPKKPDRIPSQAFDKAVASTGLDRQTLSQYASVCRKIPREERKIHLSFGHHRILAPLPSPQRLEWLALLDSESKKEVPTVKRLALSVRIAEEKPRIVTDEEITSRGEQAGHDNYGIHMIRMMSAIRKNAGNFTDCEIDRLKMFRDELCELIDNL